MQRKVDVQVASNHVSDAMAAECLDII